MFRQRTRVEQENLAADAQRLLKNDTLNRVLTAMREDVMIAIVNTPPESRDAREALYQEHTALANMQQRIANYASGY